MLRKSLALLVFVCLLVCCCPGAHAQSVNGVVTGTVTDPSGAVVPGAAVTLTNTGTGIAQTATTSGIGEYRFPLVPPGTYSIEVSAKGFATAKGNGIAVAASQTVPFPVKMTVASTGDVVEVTTQAPLVQTETSDLSLQVDNSTIQNMALVNRDVFTSLPFLAPQAMPGMDNGVTAGGARESGTSYMLNGAEDNDNFGEGGANVHPPLESIQDFTILTNNMSAEFGRGMGALVSANQKTGTNKFHGVLYEFNRNATLNANDWFYNRALDGDTTGTLTKRPKYIRNQFGGEADGPIWRDKTFFSGAYDRIKLLSGGTSANNFVPTSAAIALVKAKGGPIAQAIIGTRPPVTSDQACPSQQPGTTGAGTLVGCLSFFDPQTDTEDTYYGRVDQNFSSKDRLNFAANIYRQLYDDKFGGGPLTTKGPVPGDTVNHFHTLTLTEVHTFTNNVLNELTIAHNRHYNVFLEGNGEKDTIPNIFIDNQNEGNLSYQLGGNYEGGELQNFTQDRWAFQDNLSYLVGKHSFKFGGGSQYGILYRNWDLGLPGQYEFGEIYAADGNGNVITPASDGTLQADGTITNEDPNNEWRDNFAGDYPYFQETSVDPNTGAKANAYRHYMYHDYYIFVQDDWKVTPRLTLNLGFRWDRYGAPTEAHNIIAQFTNFNSCNFLAGSTADQAACIASIRMAPAKSMWPTQNHDFAPRFGFAFDPTGSHKMAIRGGFGIMYDRIFDNIWSNGAWNPPFYALIDFSGDGGDSIYYSNPGSIGAAYDPNGVCGPIPYQPHGACTGDKRVSTRAMDQHMKDSSGQSFYFGVERELKANLMLRVNYQGELGRHLPMLENINRVDGEAANAGLSNVRPNGLYTAFNYRSNSVTSNYHALILQAQKRMSSGLQFDASYTFSKLLDQNSELFAGCSLLSSSTAYYYETNRAPRKEYGRGSFDHTHSVKTQAVYLLPFFKAQNGFAGHVLGGWNLGGFYQFYTGHPIDVYDGRGRNRARDGNGVTVKDASGVPFNLGGDYNLDGVSNERPVFVGKSLKSVYSHATPANGIFTDNNIIGCGAPWLPAEVADGLAKGSYGGSGSIAGCNAKYGVAKAAGATADSAGSFGTPNSLFVTPNYPTSAPTYERYGTLGRDVLVGPSFAQLDVSLSKSFKLTERAMLEIKGQAQNLANHPNFDNVQGNVGDGTFGQAQLLLPSNLGDPKSRVMSIGARLAF